MLHALVKWIPGTCALEIKYLWPDLLKQTAFDIKKSTDGVYKDCVSEVGN